MPRGRKAKCLKKLEERQSKFSNDYNLIRDYYANQLLENNQSENFTPTNIIVKGSVSDNEIRKIFLMAKLKKKIQM